MSTATGVATLCVVWVKRSELAIWLETLDNDVITACDEAALLGRVAGTEVIVDVEEPMTTITIVVGASGVVVCGRSLDVVAALLRSSRPLGIVVSPPLELVATNRLRVDVELELVNCAGSD